MSTSNNPLAQTLLEHRPDPVSFPVCLSVEGAAFDNPEYRIYYGPPDDVREVYLTLDEMDAIVAAYQKHKEARAHGQEVPSEQQ